MKREFTPQQLKGKNHARSDNLNSQSEAERTEQMKESFKPPSEQVHAEKRKSTEDGSESPKKSKLESEISTKVESPTMTHGSDRSNIKKDEKDPLKPVTITANPKNDEKTSLKPSNERSASTSSFMYCCYYCENANTWNENLNEIFNHWSSAHKDITESGFLFHIAYEKSKTNESSKVHFSRFKSIALTNFQLNRLLSVKAPSHELEKADTNQIEYFLCSECNMKLKETQYFKHIEKHANELKAKPKEKHPKSCLKKIYSDTRVVFTSGLILTKHNLSTTQFGDSQVFDKYIDALLNIKAEKSGDEGSASSPSVAEVNLKHEQPPIVSSTSKKPSNRHSHSIELEKQQQRKHVMSIIGIHQRSDEILREIFSKICQKLRVRIEFEVDVAEIFRSSSNLIGVKFNDIKKKEEFLDFSRSKPVFTNEIFRDLTRAESQRIIFKNYLTSYYGKIEDHLKQACKQGKIHSFRLAEYGFEYRRAPSSSWKNILGIREFESSIRNQRAIQP